MGAARMGIERHAVLALPAILGISPLALLVVYLLPRTVGRVGRERQVYVPMVSQRQAAVF